MWLLVIAILCYGGYVYSGFLSKEKCTILPVRDVPGRRIVPGRRSRKKRSIWSKLNLVSLVGVLMILALFVNHDKPEYTALDDNEQNATSLFPLTSQLQIVDEFTFNPAKNPEFNLDQPPIEVIVMTFSNGGNGGSDSLVDAKTDRE